MMKKMLAMILTAALILGLTACGAGESPDNKAIYFLVRPLLDRLYDRRKVDGKV